MKWNLRPYQKRFCRSVTNAFEGLVNDTPFTRVLGTAATGAGKCWAAGTRMMLADGTMLAVEQLKPGDMLLGPDSLPRRITNINSGSAKLYRLTPHRHAEPMTVNGEHILSLQCTNIGNRRLTLPSGEKCGTDDTVFLTVEELLAASKTARHCLKWWQTEFQLQPRRFDAQPCPPWLLGFWLADGSSYHAEIHKPRATEWCQKDAEQMGWTVKRKNLPDGKCECASITGGFRTTLIGMDLLQNKHIPPAYLRADHETRKTLLAGILDGDGFLEKEGFELTLKKGRLADDAALLARSLGFAVTVFDKIVNGETYRRANLSGGPSLPTKRHPKRNRKQKKDPLRTGFLIEAIGEGCFHGFTIDGPDRQLLMPDGTVAHNTIMASALIFYWHKRDKRSLFLADTDELCEQSITKLNRSTGIIPDLEKAAHRASLSASVVVGSIQTMAQAKRLERWPADSFDYVIADEAHMSMADSWQRVLKKFNAGGARILGVTATPERGDKRSLMKFYEHLAAEIPMAELITERHLSPITVKTLPVEIAIRGEIKEGEQEQVGIELEAYYHAIITAIEEHAADRKKFLWFHPSVAASKRFTSLLLERGHTATHVDGSSPDRAQIIEGFHRSDFRHLNNCQMLTKGFDCPDIDTVVILRPTKSRTAYIQMAGRGTRLHCPHGCDGWCDHPDRKADMLLLDFLWEFEGHDVMGPADLLTDAPIQREALAKALKSGKPLDLLATDEFLTGERESDLLDALRRQRGKTGRTVDAVTFAAMLHQPELLEYEPVAHWQHQPVSTAQASFLSRMGIDPTTIANRGLANAIQDVVCASQREGRASVKQIKYLIELGEIDPHRLTFQQASARINSLIHQ